MSANGSEVKALFKDLIEKYLDVPIIGVQSGAGASCDLLLFRGRFNQTLACPLALVFEESQESARAFITEKMVTSDARFLQPAQSTPEQKPWRKVVRL